MPPETDTTTTPPAGGTPPPEGGTPTPTGVTEERFSALEKMVTEFGTLLSRIAGPGEGGGTGSAATGTPPSSPVPTDRDSVRAMVRDLLEARDSESLVTQMATELAELRAVVEEKLTPPKRGWGSWIMGSRP